MILKAVMTMVCGEVRPSQVRGYPQGILTKYSAGLVLSGAAQEASTSEESP